MTKTLALQLTPARCKKATTLNKVLKGWTNPTDEYEVKEDGNRYLLQVRPNGAKINYLTSRRISVHTGEFVEKQDKVPTVRDLKFNPVLWGTVFDGEWCAGENAASTQSGLSRGKGYYVVWDLLYHEGKDIRQSPRHRRLKLLKQLFDDGYLPEWMRLRIAFDDVQAALNYVKQHKKEGLVRKTRDGIYGEGWEKATATHTHDVIIWGYFETKSADWKSKGWIGALRIGQWRKLSSSETKRTAIDLEQNSVQRPVPGMRDIRKGVAYEFIDVGRCSGMTAALRGKISAERKHYLGKVIIIKCKERIAEKFRHPRFNGFHTDKNAFECIYTPAE